MTAICGLPPLVIPTMRIRSTPKSHRSTSMATVLPPTYTVVIVGHSQAKCAWCPTNSDPLRTGYRRLSSETTPDRQTEPVLDYLFAC